MGRTRTIVVFALGGSMWGSFIGFSLGAVLGCAYGSFVDDISLGLDGAILGGLSLALVGAIYGTVSGVTDKNAQRPSAAEQEARQPSSTSEATFNMNRPHSGV